MSEEQTLKPEELAKRWRITRRTLDNWEKDGRIPAPVRIGRTVRYRLSDVEAFEEKMTGVKE